MFPFGVDYYPEHWPEERWPEDARLMAEAGFNVVRLAEFAWSKMEPAEDHYDFDWLDRAISILAGHDIKVVLGTPTASAPPWLMGKSPELFRVREDGRRMTYGNRREYCPNNPQYHDYSKRIVSQMANHYADHPAVIGWQIDNEFGERCFCPTCAKAFQTWTRSKYEDLDELNQKWGTMFWSHVYTDWSEIPVPLTTSTTMHRSDATFGAPNPGLGLDYFRFMSNSYVMYQQMQADILRQTCPRHFITHNFMGFGYDQLNYFDLARPLDFVTWDNYLRMQWNMQAKAPHVSSALSHDAIRGLKHKNFWVMEQQSGPGGWEMASVTPRPGELRLWAYQGIAHGADGMVFFRWRTARRGTEQYWHGLLDHDGHLSRRYHEIKKMGAEIKEVGAQIYGSQPKSAVAMMLCYDTRFAFQLQPNNPKFGYPEHFSQLYAALHKLNVGVDIVSPTGDLSGYKMVIAPALYVLPEDVAANLKRFVQAGGTLVVTPRTGVKDADNAVVDQRLPGLLAEVCGVEVEEYDSLAEGMGNEVKFVHSELASQAPVPVGVWCDVLKTTTATVIARYNQDFYIDKPAITLNQFGQGRAIYVGTMGDEQLYGVLGNWLVDLAGVESFPTPDDVEVTERWQGDQQLLFVLNHSDEAQEVLLDGSYQNLLNGDSLGNGRIFIAARDILVLVAKMS